MEHQIYVYWPLFLWVLVFTIIPIAYAITNCICSWVDRGEESFKYPELTNISFYRGMAKWDSYDGNITPVLMLVAPLGTMVLMLLYVMGPNIAQYLMVVVLLLSVVAIVLRKVVDLAKALVAHTNDPKAHEKDSQ